MRPHPFHMVLCGLKQGTNQFAYMEEAFGVNAKVCLFNFLVISNHHRNLFTILVSSSLYSFLLLSYLRIHLRSLIFCFQTLLFVDLFCI